MADIKHTFGYINTPVYKLPVEAIRKAHEHNYLCGGPPKPKWEPSVGELVHVMRPFKVYKDNGNGSMEVHDCDGNSLTASKVEIQNYLLNNQTEYKMKAMKDAVFTVAKNLLKANNTVTTLEIKLELRRDYPYYFWTQDVVSDFMSQLAGDGLFTYTDNGTHRIYRNATPVAVKSSVYVSPTTMTGAMKNVGVTSINKLKGTVPTSTKKGVRPSKRTTLTKAAAKALAGLAGFQSVTVNGKLITSAQIRAWKKSPKGYLTPSKMNKVSDITITGITYQVK